jgi:GNAT superfamily N-acetyltransferase
MIDGYRISVDRNDLDIETIHNFISKSYWAKGIPIETLKKAIDNSLCFGVFSSQGLQVGFARMITDLSTYAYLADVYVLEEHRGKGLSKWLMQEIMAHPDMQGLRRMGLATLDAHGLYKKYGFTELATPESFMENWNPKVYETP